MTTHYQQQLVLGFPEQDDRDFSSYYPGPNAPLLECLQSFWLNRSSSSSGSGSNLYLWGAEQSGRSHLLHALCQLSTQSNHSAFYLPVSELFLSDQHQGQDPQANKSPIERVDGLEGMDLICLDDVHLLSGHEAWQEAIFHLYNRMMETGGRLVFTGSTAPRYLPIELQDLKSRVNHSLIYQISSLNDEEKCAAFKHRARARGISLPNEVANYIMNRGQRSFSNLIEVLDQLDKRSLVAKRRVTIPFVKEVMGW